MQNSENKKNNSGRLWLVVSSLVILAGMGVFYVLSQNQARAAVQSSPDTARAIGPENAPITIIEYADFNCPTCKSWQMHGIKEQILADYPNQVRFIWRDFPVITAFSAKAAEAGWCAGDQGEFWKYHDLLYFMSPVSSVQDLKDFADMASLDTQKFNQCLDSGQHQADVQGDLQDARSHGFLGTPSFLINGKPLIGPPSAQQLSSLIEAALPKGN